MEIFANMRIPGWKLIAGGAAISFGFIALSGSKSNDPNSHRMMNTAVVLEEGDVVVSSAPNIFLFTIDDMGWNDIGYNSGDIPKATPFMTDCAQRGIKLTHYYSQPSCTPSRVTMMTGKYAFRNGFQNIELQFDQNIGVPLSNKMMPAFMKDIGYRTIGYGKWNIGHCNSKYLPSERGFDHFLGYVCPGHGYTNFDCGMGAGYKDMIEGWASTVDDVTSYKWQTGAQYEGTYDTLLYRDMSTAAIRKHFDTSSDEQIKPLFMWLSQHGIHGQEDSDPIPPKSLLTEDNKEYLRILHKRLDEVGSEIEGYDRFFKMRMITASVLMSVDNSFKSLIEVVKEVDQMSNSVIFVNSDNGGDVYYGHGHPGNNYPLRGEKFLYFEGGVRVPAFVYSPTFIPGSKQGTKYHGMMHHVDLIATFYSIGGGSVGDLDGLDSINQWDAISGDTTSPRSEIVLNMPRSNSWKVGEHTTQEGVAMRVGNYKLMLNHAYDAWFSPSGDDYHNFNDMYGTTCGYDWTTVSLNDCNYTNYLFNVIDDPNEITNLFFDSDHDDVKEAMIARAYEILAAEPNEYGEIIYEYYNTEAADKKIKYKKYFKGHGDYVVPFDCDVIA